MLQQERHQLIQQQIKLYNKVLASDLCNLLHVSLDTVRRDLTELEKKGQIVKVHGGAISTNFHHPFQQPEVYAIAEKKMIAKKALSLLKDGMVLLAGGGTVMLEWARIIPENIKGTLFTVSPLVALEVAQRSTLEVILLGGQVSQHSYICSGSSVVSQLSEITVDLCLLGTNGISIDEGITDQDWEVAQVKKAMLKVSDKVAVLSIAEKLGTTQKMHVCDLKEVDYLLTDLDPADDRLSDYSVFFSIL